MPQKLLQSKPVIHSELEDILEKKFQEQDDKAMQYRDELMTKMDHIIGILEQLREDNEFHKYDLTNLKHTTDDHEKRITNLEQP